MVHSQTKLLTGTEAETLAVPILTSRFEKYGFEEVRVTEEQDFDGDPILRMIVHVRKRVPAEELVDAIDDVRTELLKAGEERFISLRTELPDEDEVEEDVEE